MKRFLTMFVSLAIMFVSMSAMAQETEGVPLAWRCNVTGESEYEQIFCMQMHKQAFRDFGADPEGEELWFQVDLISRDTGCGVAANIMVLVAYPAKFGQMYMAVSQHISLVSYEELGDEELFAIRWAVIQDNMALWSRAFGPFIGWLPESGREWAEKNDS